MMTIDAKTTANTSRGAAPSIADDANPASDPTSSPTATPLNHTRALSRFDHRLIPDLPVGALLGTLRE